MARVAVPLALGSPAFCISGWKIKNDKGLGQPIAIALTPSGP
jgi:hypothetical protein